MKVKYGDLKTGDVFEDNNWPYVKTTEANQAVELSTGALVHFFNGSLVDESDLSWSTRPSFRPKCRIT